MKPHLALYCSPKERIKFTYLVNLNLHFKGVQISGGCLHPSKLCQRLLGGAEKAEPRHRREALGAGACLGCDPPVHSERPSHFKATVPESFPQP